MANYAQKIIITGLFPVLLLCATATIAMNEIPVEKDQLWDVLKKTKLTNTVSKTDLQTQAKKIYELVTKNPSLLTTKDQNTLPVDFALANCHHDITQAILDCMLIKDPILGYKPRSKEQKQNDFLWSQKYSALLIKHVGNDIKNFLACSKATDDAHYTFLNIGLEKEAGFNWKVSCNNENGTEYDINIKTIPLAITNNKEPSRMCISITQFISPVTKQLSHRVSIDHLSTQKKLRQKGLGGALLLTAIELAKMIKKTAVEITLFAQPLIMKPITDKKTADKMLPRLINYYKSFGFLPDKNNPENLTIYIDTDGKIATALEVEELVKKLRPDDTKPCDDDFDFDFESVS